MKPSQKGEKMHKRVHVKVIVGSKVMIHDFRAPAGKGYTEDDINNQLEKCAEHLEGKFPNLDFKLVALGENRFNFIAVGMKGASNDKAEGVAVPTGNDEGSGVGVLPDERPPDRDSGTKNPQPGEAEAGASVLSNDGRAE